MTDKTKQPNVLEGMKCINLDGSIESAEQTKGFLIEDFIDTPPLKPLLRFPGLDSEGSECWSGELVKQNNTGFIHMLYYGTVKTMDMEGFLPLCGGNIN